jgi:hypothetical protein
MRRGLGRRAIQRARDRGVKRVVDERRLAGTRNAGDADEQPERQLEVPSFRLFPLAFSRRILCLERRRRSGTAIVSSRAR